MYLSTPAHSVCGGECPGGQGGIPARKWISKSSTPVLSTGICNNIGDILVKVWGEGLVLGPFSQGHFKTPRLWAICTDCKAGFCDEQCILKA